MKRLNKISWRQIETALLLFGIVMFATYAAAKLNTKVSSWAALDSFDRLPSRGLHQSKKFPETIDFTLWNPKRIRAYRESFLTKTEPAAAVLLIPKIHLKVPVFNGTDELTLNRGAGRIIGSAKIGQGGNTAIAAHRDGFFRGLKDIALGDSITLVTPTRTIHFVIDRTETVRPDDVRVLADNGVPSLTLVTCFPFYFVGSAPLRFIVHASSADFDGPNSPPKTVAGQNQNEGDLK